VDSQPTGDDAELVGRFLRSRDEASFLALYRRHTPFLLALVRRLLQTAPAEVEDVVQEAWIRAAERLAGFRGQSSLRTWLAGIAVNCCREQRRRIRRRREAGSPVDRHAVPERAPECLDLERAVGALPYELRCVLVLYALAGHTHEEVAAQLGIAPGTSKSRLFHARRALRARLEGTVAAKGSLR
jgi:RNA polymerase sigma-70 factor (ECF subfamily)